MPKGDRRERQARELYERAGYRVQPFYGRAYGETDGFSHFDMVCLQEDRPVEFVQVKSNRATGIEHCQQMLSEWFPFGRAVCRWLVCYDRKGWRLVHVYPDGHETLCDGRSAASPMGDAIIAYLRGDETDRDR